MHLACNFNLNLTSIPLIESNVTDEKNNFTLLFSGEKRSSIHAQYDDIRDR